MIQEFKDFLTRGNVVELAVAVVMGAAFGAVITSFVENLLTPLIAAIAGEPDFSALTFTINDSKFLYGTFINALISFILIAAAVFFFIVRPIGRLMARAAAKKAEEPTTKDCPHCLSEIPIAAGRCSFCTQEVPAAA